MDNDPSLTPAPRTPGWLLWARALMVIAMCGAGYLAWVSLSHGAAAGCGVESGCNAVLQSRWAYWLDVPVSVPAVLVYIALLGTTVLLQKRTAPDDERGSWAALIVLSVLVMGSAFWFVGLQVFVMQSFCKYCLTAHVCGFTAALLCLMNIPFATDPETPMWASGSGKRGVPRRAMCTLIPIGLVGVVVLAGGQVLVQKERNVVKDLNHRAASTNLLVLNSPNEQPEAVPPSPNARLIAPRTLSLYSNQFIIKFDSVPLRGSPDATNVLVCMLDYTCMHCRALHPILKAFSGQYSNQFAIVCLPVSLSAKCNPFIPKLFSLASTNSCELARLSLAVWRAKPAVHQQFDDWLFSGVNPPAVEQARNYAAQLVGADPLRSALADPWVTQQIVTDCKIHRANWLAVDSSAMPQIVMGNAVSSGPINSVEHLQLLLQRYMGLYLAPAGR